MDLILVRHAVTDWNDEGRLMGRLPPITLNARGRSQAVATARALLGLPITAVLSSPQTRAQETAEIIAKQFDLELQIEPALAEVWLGRWQGRTFRELQGDADAERFLADPLHICDAFEPAADVRTRMVALMERLRVTATNDAVVLVSHGDPLRVAVAHILRMGLGAYRQMVIDPASITIARLGGSRGRILTLNWLPEGPATLAFRKPTPPA